MHEGKVYAAVVNLPGRVNKAADLNRPVLEVDFATGKGELVRLDLATGAIDWSVELDTMPLGAMTVSNDLLFTTLFDGRLVAHSLEDGSEVWSSRLPAGTNSPVAIAGDGSSRPQASRRAQARSRRSSSSGSTASGSRLPGGGAMQTRGGRGRREAAHRGGVVEVGSFPARSASTRPSSAVEAGEVTFRFDNTEAMAHDFVIEKDGERIGGTEFISNESAEVTVELEAGEYTFYCTPQSPRG